MYLDGYIGQIKKICEKQNVRNLFAFGSVLTDKFNNDSDIDFIADIESYDPIEYAERQFKLKFEPEELFKRQIDLLEKKA